MESNNIIRKKKRKRISYLIVLYGKNSNYFEIIYPAIKIGPKSCFKKKEKRKQEKWFKSSIQKLTNFVSRNFSNI